MREILFRGKTEKGEWVQGVPTKDDFDATYIVEGIFECDEYRCNGADCFDVDENTIGQYTGLTDKNGKKIFEGDILSVTVQEYEEAPDDWSYKMVGSRKIYTGRKIKTVWTVEHKNHYCRGIGFFLYGKDRRFNVGLSKSVLFNANAEVIGNIHDNPELLEGSEDNESKT